MPFSGTLEFSVISLLLRLTAKHKLKGGRTEPPGIPSIAYGHLKGHVTLLINHDKSCWNVSYSYFEKRNETAKLVEYYKAVKGLRKTPIRQKVSEMINQP